MLHYNSSVSLTLLTKISFINTLTVKNIAEIIDIIFLEESRHIRRIVYWITQRKRFILGVSDDQSSSLNLG